MSGSHFIIAGAQRCGTTALAQLLAAVPGVAMARPMRPEPKFFLAPRVPADVSAYYKRFFSHCADARLLGEKSVAYMDSRVAMVSIRRTLPDAKLLFLLRDPVARAVSHYRFTRAHGLEDRPLERALQEPERTWHAGDAGPVMSPWAYLSRGDYASQLVHWTSLFPPGRIWVDALENLLADAAALQRIAGFLGVHIPMGTKLPVANADSEPAECDGALLDALAARFALPNQLLAERHGIDTSRWRGTTE